MGLKKKEHCVIVKRDTSEVSKKHCCKNLLLSNFFIGYMGTSIDNHSYKLTQLIYFVSFKKKLGVKHKTTS